VWLLREDLEQNIIKRGQKGLAVCCVDLTAGDMIMLLGLP
jgi:hypothetical protein